MHHSGQQIHFKPSTADLVRGLEIVPRPSEVDAQHLPVATALALEVSTGSPVSEVSGFEMSLDSAQNSL